MKVEISNPQHWIGVRVYKDKVTADCVSYKEHVKKDGTKTYILTWRCLSPSGLEFFQETGWKSVPYGIKKHESDRDENRVRAGKRAAFIRKNFTLSKKDLS